MSTTPDGPDVPQQGQPIRPGSPQPGPTPQYHPAQDPTAGPQGAAHQYGRQGGKYGTSEYDPNRYTGMIDRPAVFDRLLKLTLLSLGVYVLSSIIGMIANATTDLVEAYRQMGVSTEMAEQMAGGPGTGWVTSIVSLVIGIVLYLVVYNGLKKGKNWARVLGTVFAALAILSGLFGLFGATIFGGLGILLIVVGVVQIIVDILWIVTAYRAPNSAYFAQNKRG